MSNDGKLLVDKHRHEDECFECQSLHPANGVMETVYRVFLYIEPSPVCYTVSLEFRKTSEMLSRRLSNFTPCTTYSITFEQDKPLGRSQTLIRNEFPFQGKSCYSGRKKRSDNACKRMEEKPGKRSEINRTRCTIAYSLVDRILMSNASHPIIGNYDD